MHCWACGLSTACWGLTLEHAPRSRLLCSAEVKLKKVSESSFRNIVLKLIWSFLDQCQTVDNEVTEGLIKILFSLHLVFNDVKYLLLPMYCVGLVEKHRSM